MDIDLHARCKKLVDQFLRQYDELCEELGHKKSFELYRAAADAFLAEVPKQPRHQPYRFTDKKITKLYESLVKSKGAANRESLALALHRIILICKQNNLVDGRVMISRRIRSEELAVHDTKSFALLDDFIPIRNWLGHRIQRTPRSRKDLTELVVAALIAINGIVLPSAHLKICASRRTSLGKCNFGSLLSVPVAHYASKNSPCIQYPLLPEIERLINHIKGSGDWIFPDPWLPLRRDTRRRNTKRMNQWLHDLWLKVHGEHQSPPAVWNIQTFIRCSRLNLALTVPPVVVAHLSGRVFFGAYNGAASDEARHELTRPTTEEQPKRSEESERQGRPEALVLGEEIIEAIGGILGRFHRKKQNPGSKKDAEFCLMSMIIAYSGVIEQLPSLNRLIRWMLWELRHDGGKRKMGTFQAMWRFIPRPILNELEHEDPVSLSREQWYRLVEYLIQENNYSSETRRKIKQHLKAFHGYLCQSHSQVQPLNWRIGALQVRSEPGQVLFPTLGEFDLLFSAAGRHPDRGIALQLQAALTLAFYGGLRAEEICLISKMDLDEISLQIRVWWSKTRKGRRRVPIGLLIPNRYLVPVIQLSKRCITSKSLLLSAASEQPSPDLLGKRIKNLIVKTLPSYRSMSIHSLRHGFASWLLVRYFALAEPELLRAEIFPDSSHLLFSPQEQKKLVRVFNGRIAGEHFESNPTVFQTKPEHFRMISDMIGHATRDTTARTYIHSMPWIASYYIRRLAEI